MATGHSKLHCSKSKEIINNDATFFETEVSNPTSTPPRAFTRKASEATGVPERTIRGIKAGHAKGQTTQETPTRRTSSQIKIDDFDCGVIRRKIHEFYTLRKQLSTLKHLHKVLQEEISFPGSISFLRKILRSLGFRWKKCQSNRTLLMEKPEIVNLRIQFLRKLKAFKDEGLDLVYMDETWIDTSYTTQFC
jgi:transposase